MPTLSTLYNYGKIRVPLSSVMVKLLHLYVILFTGGSLFRGSLSKEVPLSRGALSKGVSVQGGLCSGGLCPKGGGLCPRGSLSRGSLSGESLSGRRYASYWNVFLFKQYFSSELNSFNRLVFIESFYRPGN